MRRPYVGPRGGDVPVCGDCGKRHHTKFQTQACAGHVTTDRDSYVKGQDRTRLPEPRPCVSPPVTGLATCRAHGAGNPAAIAAGKRRTAEADAEAAVIRKLGESGTPITDPIATLCGIAGRAVRFMELIGQQVDTLEGRQLTERVRAEIALYERSMGRAATVVESLIRMGIAERLAKVEEEQTAAIVKFIDGVLTDLGHNPRAPEVAGVVARRLELVS